MCGLGGSERREQAQKPTCKDLGCNGQKPAITTKAAYTSVSKRADSRSARSHRLAMLN
ncbi:alpha-galactosidase [Lacticaseibacillus paracasei]|nr:alpha-galactosidase [Lacticaseibacillus paracasei]